ncbi:MAG: MarR family winged helix-turn-helix transcriptional regulator [Eubacteriaceae bacterium]
MEPFASQLNSILVDTFNSILKVEEAMLKHSETLDLSISEMHLIESVGKKNSVGKTISDIAQDLGITLPSVTIAINKLLKKGYVKKEKSELDGRVVNVHLTEKGLRVNKIHQYFHRKMVNEISKEMTDQEKRVLIQGINKLNHFFEKKLLVLSEKK